MATMRFGDLIARLSDLFEDLAGQCHSIEDMAVLGRAGGGPASAESLVAFQRLDLIAQSLHDLSSLAGSVGQTELTQATINPEVLRTNLRLTSLADRLLGKEPQTDEEEGFLL